MSPTSSGIHIFAPAKINLYLHVGEKRADGFHDLESLVAFADVGDRLRIVPADQLDFLIDGAFADGLGSDDNLVLKAVRTFAARTGLAINARITLTKNLPVASGIGGGSADAAAALRGLAELYPDAAGADQLRDMAEALGSDVPACLQSQPLVMRGRGEWIDLLQTFPQLPVLLVNPGVAVGTVDVFRQLKTRTGTGVAGKPDVSSALKLVRYLRGTRNDLEAPARAIAPVIGEVLDEILRMPGIQLARMSGSGATCFGIFDSAFEAEMAATALSKSHPDWWVRAVNISSSPEEGDSF